MIDIYMTHDLHQSLKHILRDSEMVILYGLVENHYEEVFVSRAKASWNQFIVWNENHTMNCAFYQDLEVVA